MATSQAEKNAYKIMRRGTRACSECRRRKIKCIYEDTGSDICQECTTHNRRCVKQGMVRGSDRSQSNRAVKVQVTRLESAVQKLARASLQREGDSTKQDKGSQETRVSDEAEIVMSQEQLRKRSPIFSLFNNDILHQRGAFQDYTSELSRPTHFPDSCQSDREKLLSTIANVPDIYKVLHFASCWWISWREQNFALRSTEANRNLHDFVQMKLDKESPAAVALGLTAIAIALGQIRPGIDDLSFNLPVPAHHITNYILAAVDQIVCDSEKYLTHDDSVLLFMLRAKHHTENNQVRKAWLRLRQAIRCAQTTGFGIASPLDGALSDEEADRQRLVASIFEIDHFISMILGFPYAKDPAFIDARAFAVLLDPSINDESLKMRALRRIIAVTAAHINDRNAGNIPCEEFTENTQDTLDMAANSMPPDWWNMLEQPLAGLAVHRYESIMVQLWFWTVQAYLHLPNLIKPSDAHPASRSRQLCMDGTRNLLRSFNYLRTDPAVSVYMCNCDDFQALLGACILLVGILQEASRELSTAGTSVEPHTIDSDLALIEEVKDVFRYRMHEQGGSISRQGLAVLEELTCFLYDEEDEQASAHSSDADLSGLNIGLNREQKTIMLPYFGTITLQLTKKLPKRRLTEHSAVSMPTPPHSLDGTFRDNTSPSQDWTLYTTPSSLEETIVADLPLLHSQSKEPGAWDVDRLEPQPQELVPQQHFMDNATDTTPPGVSQSISWESWGSYMFDQELEQDWNPGLQASDHLDSLSPQLC